MDKVLLAVPNSKNWIGGLNYFKSLVNAHNSLPEKKIELVVISHGEDLPSPLNKLKRIENVSLPAANDPIIRRIIRKIRRTFQRQDAIVDQLIKEDIKLFSHGYYLGKGSPIPSLRWIPDFQDRYLPAFFSQQELLNRKFEQNLMVTDKQAILFSSQTAQNDFNKFYPDNKCPSYVLKFVSTPALDLPKETMEQALKRYNIHEPFFYIPNQLWAHKNHRIVVEALHILKQRGNCPLVISTGHTEDYRNPNFFTDLKNLVSNYQLEDRMVFLGLIEFETVSTLTRKAIAIINPSLFEGWSTTVEESKSIGKKVILSDIAVHKEQSPERGIFFDPYNAAQLADAIVKVLREYDPQEEIRFAEKAANDLPGRIRTFGLQYEKIALDLIAKRNK